VKSSAQVPRLFTRRVQPALVKGGRGRRVVMRHPVSGLLVYVWAIYEVPGPRQEIAVTWGRLPPLRPFELPR
jgi:hypothetical protein